VVEDRIGPAYSSAIVLGIVSCVVIGVMLLIYRNSWIETVRANPAGFLGVMLFVIGIPAGSALGVWVRCGWERYGYGSPEWERPLAMRVASIPLSLAVIFLVFVWVGVDASFAFLACLFFSFWLVFGFTELKQVRAELPSALVRARRKAAIQSAEERGQRTSQRICRKHRFVMTYDNQTSRYFCPLCDKEQGASRVHEVAGDGWIPLSTSFPPRSKQEKLDRSRYDELIILAWSR
jgi:hypothetical protein